MDDRATTTMIVLKELAGHGPITLSPLQRAIFAHYDIVHACWIALWWLTLGILLLKLWYEYRSR